HGYKYSTSLQNVLSTYSHELKSLGYFYPFSGRPATAPHGHHNIAWAISDDYRYLTESGSIDDLLTEIAGLRQGIILSSEDFECSAYHARRFSLFIKFLKRHKFDVKIIIYLRNQVEYAKSLY